MSVSVLNWGGGTNLEGYFIQVTQIASFWRKLRIQYRIVTRIRCPKKVITLRFSLFFFFFFFKLIKIVFYLFVRLLGPDDKKRVVGWWYGSCKVIKSWRLVPHSSNWAVNPKTNYRYRSTDTPTMPADPLNGALGGESTKVEILPQYL